MQLPRKEVKIRNEYGTSSGDVGFTLPEKTRLFLSEWAKKRGLTLSRAVNIMIWNTYHIEKGDYIGYDEYIGNG